MSKEELEFFDRNPDWSVKNELEFIHKRFDVMYHVMQNQDRKYNIMWQSYERKYMQMLNSLIVMAILFLLILMWVIFGDSFK